MTGTRVFRNARIVTMTSGLETIENGALVASDGLIRYVGDEAGLTAELVGPDPEEIDCGGRLITPGLIDCHTHLVFGGDRAAEFEARLEGASYEETARRGGGIVSTVRATRAATEDELTASALHRLDHLIAEGVTTIEIKSGYGLELASELRSLTAARRLGRERPITVRTTFLGAHTVPPEAAGDRDGYVDRLCREMIPAVAAASLADAVDGFCETIAFSPAEIARVFDAAKAHGLPVKLHADQLSDSDGAALAASYGSLSADHLEYTSEAGAAALAASGTVAAMLPGAFYALRETQVPPIDAFRRHGVPLAVATDCNPGTSPLTSILLAMNMAATLFRLTVTECLLGTTRHAARALGLADRGTLAPGQVCDLAVWDVDRPAELVYRMGYNPLFRRVWRGV